MISSRLFLAGALVCAATAFLSATAFADPADDLFVEGNAAFTAGHVDAAYEKLSAAWKLKQSFDIAANLALVESKLSKKRDAAEHLDYALHTFPAIGEKAAKTRMESDLAALQADVGRIEVDVPADTLVSVDGKAIGRAPFGRTIYVEPGSRRISGDHPKLGSGETSIACAKGAITKVAIDLKVTSGPTTKVIKHPSVVPAIVAYAVGAIGIGIGGGFTAVAGSQLDKARALAKGRTCAAGDPTKACADISSAISKSDTSANVGVAGFVVGGAGVAAGTGLLIWSLVSTHEEDESKKASARIRVVPLVSAETNGLWLTGSF